MILHQPLFERINEEVRAGRAVALCAVVKTRGSTPQAPGALMLVDHAMAAVGTLGGGCVEAEVRKQAFELLQAREAKLLTFQLDHDFGWDDGLICGGGMDIAVMPIADATASRQFEEAVARMGAGHDVTVELQVDQQGERVAYQVRVEREPTLLIAGAGHVGAELARLCVGLEFRVVVVDDRPDFANAERLPPPIEPIVGDIEQTLRGYPIDLATYVVVVTRGHRHDEQALGAVIDSNARYLGMIGSRRKIKLIFDDLREAGATQEQLERVHAPIGLPIRAVTVPEIAVSIAAQLVEVRRADQAKVVIGPLPISEEES
ncbi:MAG: XdhC/CoxI family protein [bacterium]|nr:XdhC/CoxI family protein [bacterium]